MSRIGKKVVVIPDGVQVTIEDQTVTVKGKLGSLTREFHPGVQINQEENHLSVAIKNREGNSALWGLTRSLLSNMVVGVSKGFSRVLEIQGVGYRAAVNDTVLQLNLGYSHPIDYALPSGVTAQVEKNVVVTLSGMDPETIGQACADIRRFRPPEPYKGKGIRNAGEYILRKVGKKK
ncbi:50S ribosomal protein L6 [Candidatus Magnetaquicoccus inordinatus]|uniref:50S ribosomal protein L6 n=1 Tax=Candidatus Magnetaquicoccus inordinatus TaxID=2496818 RepID=UPI00102AC793|nr:50S ribosomal protein L6 [Candidatus Magnetaquicoccus inordinatus]